MTYKERRFVIEDASKPFEVPFEFKHNIILCYRSKGSSIVKCAIRFNGISSGFSIYNSTKTIVKLHGVLLNDGRNYLYGGTMTRENNINALHGIIMNHNMHDSGENAIVFSNGIAVGDEIILVEW